MLLLSHFSCVRLCDPIDSRPPGSPVPGILQARTLDWVAISFSNAWKWKVKVKPLSRVRLLATPWTAAYQAPLSMGFSRQEHWSGVPLPSPHFWEQPHKISEFSPYIHSRCVNALKELCKSAGSRLTSHHPALAQVPWNQKPRGSVYSVRRVS